jgi:hypothetical protein
MKLLSIILVSLFVTNVFAETVVEKIAENKNWIANKIDMHNAWNTSSCVASTLGSNAILEIYAEKMVDGITFAEPTVQVLFASASVKEEAFSAEASTNGGKKWTFTRASTSQDPNTHVMLAKLKDRAEIIDRIKKDSSLNLKLKNVKGKTIVDLKFSLSGSSKTVTSQVDVCKLKFDTL